MNAKLVAAAGHQPAAEQRQPGARRIERSDRVEAGDAAPASRRHHDTATVVWIESKRRVDLAAAHSGGVDASVHDGEIDLFARWRPERSLQRGVNLGRLRDDDDAGRQLVETSDE